MRYRKNRRFMYRSNGRNHKSTRNNGVERVGLGSHSFSNGRMRHNMQMQQSPEKLVEKYNLLAKEALSSGDKILSENYLQHADHYMRIIEAKLPVNSKSVLESSRDNSNRDVEKK